MAHLDTPVVLSDASDDEEHHEIDSLLRTIEKFQSQRMDTQRSAGPMQYTAILSMRIEATPSVARPLDVTAAAPVDVQLPPRGSLTPLPDAAVPTRPSEDPINDISNPPAVPEVSHEVSSDSLNRYMLGEINKALSSTALAASIPAVQAAEPLQAEEPTSVPPQPPVIVQSEPVVNNTAPLASSGSVSLDRQHVAPGVVTELVDASTIRAAIATQRRTSNGWNPAHSQRSNPSSDELSVNNDSRNTSVSSRQRVLSNARQITAPPRPTPLSLAVTATPSESAPLSASSIQTTDQLQDDLFEAQVRLRVQSLRRAAWIKRMAIMNATPADTPQITPKKTLRVGGNEGLQRSKISTDSFRGSESLRLFATAV